MPNAALIRFQRETCPDVSLDSPEITFKLIQEINKLKGKKKEIHE